MKKLFVLFISGAMASYVFAANTVVLTLNKTTKTCTPDGVANTDGSEPWTTSWIDMIAEKPSNTVHEMTSHFQIAFNDTYLWIVSEQMGNSTIDTDHTAIPNSWERDDFEIFITMDTTSWIYGGKYGEANNQFRMQRDAEYPWGFDDSHSIGANNPGTFNIGQVDAGDGSFVQEWQIPWTGLIAPMVDSGHFYGSFIKFEIQAADNTTGSTGGRNDQRFWINGSDNEYQDSRTLALISLHCFYIGSCDEVKEINKTDNAIIFPNPATEYLKIRNEGNLKSVTLRNILGVELRTIAVQNEKTITVPLTDFALGIYLVTITDKQGLSLKYRIVKE